jgi:hypothetical protein
MLEEKRYKFLDRSPGGGTQRGGQTECPEQKPQRKAALAAAKPASLLLLVLPVFLLAGTWPCSAAAQGSTHSRKCRGVAHRFDEHRCGDTQDLTVHFVVRYHAPSLWQQWFGEPLLDFDLLRLRLVTEKGRSIVPKRKSYSNFEAVGGPLYAGELSCSLLEVPSSAKQLSLQVPVTLGEKSALPVVVRVR